MKTKIIKILNFYLNKKTSLFKINSKPQNPIAIRSKFQFIANWKKDFIQVEMLSLSGSSLSCCFFYCFYLCLQLGTFFFGSFNLGKQGCLSSCPFLLHSGDFWDFSFNTVGDSFWLTWNLKLSAEGLLFSLELLFTFFEIFNLICKLFVVLLRRFRCLLKLVEFRPVVL